MGIKRSWLAAITLFVLIISPTPGQAEPYLEVYVGPNFTPEVNPVFIFSKGVTYQTAKNVGVDPSFIVGGKIGYWFSKEAISFLPEWIKYFGLALDISYHPLNWPNQSVYVVPPNTKFNIANDGMAINAAFLISLRYGFRPDAEVPFGRWQPYVEVGPWVFFAKTHLNIGRDFRSQEADIGIAVGSGIRYMVRKNISLDLGFRYRYVPSHVNVDDSIFNNARHDIRMKVYYSFFNVIFGAAYHF